MDFSQKKQNRTSDPAPSPLPSAGSGTGHTLQAGQVSTDVFFCQHIVHQEKALAGRWGKTLKHFSPQIISVISFYRCIMMKILPNILPK